MNGARALWYHQGMSKILGSKRIMVAALVALASAGCDKASYYGPPAPEPAPVTPIQPLLLIQLHPADGATGIPEDAVIETRFSRAPDPKTVTVDTFSLIDEEGAGAVSGRVEGIAESGEGAPLRYRFLPAEPLLVPEHPYRIEIGASIATPDGARLDLELSPVATPARFLTGEVEDTIPPHFFAYGHRAEAVGPTAIRLTWYPAFDNPGGTPPGLMVYAIYAGVAPDAIDLDRPEAVTPPGATEYKVGGLSPNTAYYFVIHAIDEAGNEDGNSVVVSARTWLSTGETELTILYSADVFATIEPCG